MLALSLLTCRTLPGMGCSQEAVASAWQGACRKLLCIRLGGRPPGQLDAGCSPATQEAGREEGRWGLRKSSNS